MDWSPQTNYHRTHYEALGTPNLAKSSLSVMSLGDVDQWGLICLHYKGFCTIMHMLQDRWIFSDASHCFCLTLPKGNVWKLTQLTCLLYSQLMHMVLTFYCLIQVFNANFEESSCEEHCSLWFTAHWVTADSNWRTWLLAGAAGQADGNPQNSPLMGSLREKGQHPILEMYYFHIS